MKKVIKHVARAGWRLTGPLRRPIGRKVDGKLARVVADVVEPIVRREVVALVHPRLDGLEHNVYLGRGEVNAHGNETNLMLDSLVREVGRLQMQIEGLQESLSRREAEGEAEGLSVVSDGFAADRSKVG